MSNKAVIWDLDDTLLDTTGMIFSGRKAVLTELFPSLPEQAYIDWNYMSRYINSHNVINSLRIALSIHGISAEQETLIEAESLFWTRFMESARLKDGALDALTAIAEKGIVQGLVTNGKVDLQMEKFQSVEIAQFFSPEHIVVYRGKAAKGKPMPDGVLECVEKLGKSPADCLYVGDRLTDVIAGNMAGVTTVQITAPRNRKRWEVASYPIETADIFIDRPDQLLAHLL